MKLILGFLIGIFSIAFASVARAQTYPVQANVYVMPPYGKHLNDYYTTSKEKLVVSLLNRDQLKPTLEVRLRMTITASNGLKIQSKEEINYPTITLDANIPTRLTQDDLMPYFQHINSQGFLSQGKLPDGMVEFTFQAIEKHTNKILSAPATGRIWLTSQNPPILRLPSNAESIAYRDPLNLKFQWEPQHKNLSQIEYEFELRELPPNGAAPQSAFLYATPIWTERLLYNYLIYDVMMPSLEPNKLYAWRVRAIAKDGVDELNLFENNGYSEIFFFTTQTDCPCPSNLSASLQARRLDLKWLPAPGNNEFVVQYRPKYGTSVEDWASVNTFEDNASIYDIQRGTVYEYRVGGICTTGQPVFTPVKEITIPAVDSARIANCGIPPVLDIENKERLPELKVGDLVHLSDYPMTVTKVAGANGNFTGEGWVPVNWLLETKWAVEFSNITVNTDYKLIGGSVRAKYDETEGNIANLDDITEGGIDNTKQGIIRVHVEFDFAIPDNPVFEYNPDTGELIVYSTDGQQAGTVKLPKNDGKVVFPITVKGENGDIYKIDTPKDENGNPITDENGNVSLESTYLGNQGKPLADDSFDRKNISQNVAMVTFQKGKNADYTFDQWRKEYDKISKITGKYEHLSNASERYHVPWKWLPVGGSDRVEATVSLNKNYKDNTGQHVDPAKIIFTTSQGTSFKADYDGKETYTISLVAGEEGDVQEIYALYPENGSSGRFFTLGKLNVVSYRPQTHKLVVVQVNGNTVDEKLLKDKLQETYSPVGLTWDIAFDNYDYSGHTKGFFEKNSSLLSAYNQKMKDLQTAYKESKGGLDGKTSYLFILDDSGDAKNRHAQGFMPRGEQFGYIFRKNIADAGGDIHQVVAHELGHGVWKLSHTFDSTYGSVFKESEKENLMSYGGGTHLAKWQWDVINDPAWFANPLDGDEKGMVTAVSLVYLKPYMKNETYTFITPAGNYITLPAKDIKKVYFSTFDRAISIQTGNEVSTQAPIGSLIAFTTNSDTTYNAIFENNNFKGYYVEGDKEYTIFDINKSLQSVDYGIASFLGFDNGKIVNYIGNFKSANKNAQTIQNGLGTGTLMSNPFIIDISTADTDKTSFYSHLENIAEDGGISSISDINYKLNNGEEIVNLLTLQTAGGERYTVESLLQKLLTKESSIDEYLYYFSLINQYTEYAQKESAEELQHLLLCISQIDLDDIKASFQLIHENKTSPYSDHTMQTVRMLGRTGYETLKERAYNSNQIYFGLRDIFMKSKSNQLDTYYKFLKENLKNDTDIDCSLVALEIDVRLEIIDDLIDSKHFSIEGHPIIYHLINTTPEKDAVKLLKGVQANNYKWLRTIKKEADWTNVKQIYSVINELLLTNYNSFAESVTQNVSIQTSIFDNGIEKTVTEKYPLGFWQPTIIGLKEEYRHSYIPDTQYKYCLCSNSLGATKVGIDDNGSINFYTCYVKDYVLQIKTPGTVSLKTEHENLSLNPFEPMDLVVIGDFGAIGMDHGTVISTTAMMGMLLAEDMIEYQKDKTIREVFDMAMIGGAVVAAPFTGGGSLAALTANIAVVAGVSSTIDLAASATEANMTTAEYEANKEVIEAWNDFHTVVSTADGLAGGAVLSKSIYQGVRTIGSWNRFVRIAKVNNAKLTKDAKLLWNTIKGGSQVVVNQEINLQKLLKNNAYKEIYQGLKNGNIERRFINELSLEEEAAFKFYTNKSYYNFNKALIDGSKADDILEIEKLLNGALDKIPSSPGTYYRGIGKDEIAILDKLEKGSKITYQNFLSTSSEQEKGIEFFYSNLNKTNEGAIIKVISRNGKQIDNFSDAVEWEILHKSKSEFEIIDINDNYIVNIEDVAFNGDTPIKCKFYTIQER